MSRLFFYVLGVCFAMSVTAQAKPQGSVPDTTKATIVQQQIIQQQAGPQAGAGQPGQVKSRELTGEEQQALLKKIETYFNSLKTVRVAFVQTPLNGHQKGKMATGHMFWSRPGKLRMEYDEPNDILLIAHTKQLVYYDAKADQVSHVATDSTPAALLLKDSFSFNDGVKVESVNVSKRYAHVKLLQTKDPEAGSLELDFAIDPMRLEGWTITDKQGTRIRIILHNENHKPFSSKEMEDLFVFKNPRLYGRKGFTRTPKWYDK